MTSSTHKEETLCWCCANATGECSWSNHHEHKPVPGWMARETKIKSTGNLTVDSYLVLDCPEFIADSRHYGLIRLNKEEKE